MEEAFDHRRFEFLVNEESVYKCTLSTLTAFYELRQSTSRHSFADNSQLPVMIVSLSEDHISLSELFNVCPGHNIDF